MIQQVRERPFGYRRMIIHTVMTCDCCGRRITYSSSPEFGKHYCEKCYKAQQEEKKNVSTAN